MYQDINDKGGLATSLAGLGNTAVAQGDYEMAWQHLQQALRLAVELRYARLIGAILMTIGELWIQAGQQDRGLALLTVARGHPALEPVKQRRAQQLLELYGRTLQNGQMEHRSLDELATEVLANAPVSASGV